MSSYQDPNFQDFDQQSVNSDKDLKNKTSLDLTLEDDPIVKLQKGIEKGDEFGKLEQLNEALPQTQEEEDSLQKKDKKPIEKVSKDEDEKDDGLGDLWKRLEMLKKPIEPEQDLSEQNDEDELDLMRRLEQLKLPDVPVDKKDARKEVAKIKGKLDGIEVGTKLTPEKVDTQGTHPIYKIKHNHQNYYLKKVGGAKDEETGLNAQAAHGVSVPEHAEIVLDDGYTYQVTGEIKYLQEGFFGIGWYADEGQTKLVDKQAQLLFDLGKQHIADIRVCNVDRLPWEGNSYRANLKNVFIDLLTGKLLGLDTEADMNITEEKEKDIKAELLKIEKSPEGCADMIYDIISKGGKTGKLDATALKKKDFVDVFAKGLSAGLKIDYTSPYM
ncbi:hypothetical protein [Aureispira anguillae]|uniref:Uncharacterized protein n=1 Tax=Aureispira anguillae TaxID=2864201 RepID=A0A915YHJ9_9BACT|nr:hypothetical protein [Aureispira anguillae]BDS13147.1 hypothetical protein AsAng_0038750 [Aureispira anguillae]